MSTSQDRPVITELRLSAFKSHRGASFGFGPLTLLTGDSGTGKSSVLEALAMLGRLACGVGLDEVFATMVRGGAAACVPQDAQPDAQGRRGFRLGCTVTGPVGPVRLDLAVQAEPTLRIVGERLTGVGETLLTTALRDPARPSVQAAWHTAGVASVTRAPLPDDRLATALLPLRVSGRTAGQRLVLAAAEQMVVALRGVFPVAPRPELMRGPVPVGDGRLRAACDNLSAVLARTEGECGIRHAALVNAVRSACSPPVEGLTSLPAMPRSDEGGPAILRTDGLLTGDPAVDAVIAAVDRGPLGLIPIDRLGDGELRFLALALVLLTGPGVLDVDTSTELLPASQVLTVLADGLDQGLDAGQSRELLRLAALAAGRGHIRLLGTVRDTSIVEGIGGVAVTLLGGRRRVPAQDPGRAERGSAERGSAERESGEPVSAEAVSGEPVGAEPGRPGSRVPEPRVPEPGRAGRGGVERGAAGPAGKVPGDSGPGGKGPRGKASGDPGPGGTKSGAADTGRVGPGRREFGHGDAVDQSG